MNILSFNFFEGSHDTSAAVVCDGRLVAAAEEERFTRKKHDGSVPLKAIDFCLRRAGLRMEEVDVIAFPDKPFRSGSDSCLMEMDADFHARLLREGVVRQRSRLHRRLLATWRRLSLPRFNVQMSPAVAAGFRLLRGHYPELPSVRYYDHHLSHAAAAFLTSPYEQAAIATIDGRSEFYSTVTWRGEGNRIRRVRAEPYTNSLGFFYRDCTRYLGLGEFGEGKTMGLAAYGDKQVCARSVSSLLAVAEDSWYRYRARPSEQILGFAPRKQDPITEARYANFAAACQSALEEAVSRVAFSAIRDAKCANLCLGGGVALNCSCNGALLASGVPDSMWVFPASGDAGLSVGAALLCAAEAGELRREEMEMPYLGPQFTDQDCAAALQPRPGILYRRADRLDEEVARALAASEVVGWFHDRMELGPRALGNRSILAAPHTVAIRDRVNRIKGRELWRPLAPVVLAERAAEFFELRPPSPFMLFASQVRAEKRQLIPAVIHIDGSARPQTVAREQNPRLYDLLSAFDRLTGVPVLLNTSLNASGEPMVCSPDHAIRTFVATGLDLLVLGNFLVRRDCAGQRPHQSASPR